VGPATIESAPVGPATIESAPVAPVAPVASIEIPAWAFISFSDTKGTNRAFTSLLFTISLPGVPLFLESI
jgi:hypothetical protein